MAAAMDNLLINTYNRETHSLNGDWHIIIDPYENGYYNYRWEPFDQMEYPWKSAFYLNSVPADNSDLVEYNFDQSPTLKVPGDWNSQMDELLYYEGTVWYKTSFDHLKSDLSNRVFLYFGAVNYEAHVYLNGTKLGTHIGGFTPFNFEVTGILKEKDNFLIVKVDNKRKKEAVPTLNTDWWNYGGVTRDVKLVETPETFIRDYFLQLDPKTPDRVFGYVQLDGEQISEQPVLIEIQEVKFEMTFFTDQSGKASIDLLFNELTPWSITNPKLHTVIFSADRDKLTDQIGFRTIQTRGNRILLNGDEIFLKGISIHEENPIRGGRANSKEDAKLLLGWAKELGCNYVRLAHYPHNEHMVRLADQMGLLVWEEIPVYWTIDWDNPETYLTAENQLREMILRDRNRACTIIWSMANETPVSEARNQFLQGLANTARELDPTRLISAALEQSNYEGSSSIRTISDPFANVADILSFNQYVGWYDGLPDKCSEISWKIKQDKPVVISEFGAGAKQGYHADRFTRFSEEFQEDLYIQTLKMIGDIPQLSGISPWILVDFRSPRRPLPIIQDGWNRKGLISDKGEKKKAFFVLKDYYIQK